MGDRYYVTVVCPGCGEKAEDVYYAPTSGFLTHRCSECGRFIDLEAYTGIDAASTSNLAEIRNMIRGIRGRSQ